MLGPLSPPVSALLHGELLHAERARFGAPHRRIKTGCDEEQKAEGRTHGSKSLQLPHSVARRTICCWKQEFQHLEDSGHSSKSFHPDSSPHSTQSTRCNEWLGAQGYAHLLIEWCLPFFQSSLAIRPEGQQHLTDGHWCQKLCSDSFTGRSPCDQYLMIGPPNSQPDPRSSHFTQHAANERVSGHLWHSSHSCER